MTLLTLLFAGTVWAGIDFGPMLEDSLSARSKIQREMKMGDSGIEDAGPRVRNRVRVESLPSVAQGSDLEFEHEAASLQTFRRNRALKEKQSQR